MKYERICTVPRGQVIPEEEDGYEVKVIAENLDDEIALKNEAITELEKEAIEGINGIIAKVEAATGRTLKGIKYVEGKSFKGPKFRPTLTQPQYGELREHCYTLAHNVHSFWSFSDEEAFLDWVGPIFREGFRS